MGKDSIFLILYILVVVFVGVTCGMIIGAIFGPIIILKKVGIKNFNQKPKSSYKTDDEKDIDDLLNEID